MRHVSISDFYLALPDYGLTPSEAVIVKTRLLRTVETDDLVRWMRAYPVPGLWSYQWSKAIKGGKIFYEMVLYMTHPDMAFETKMKFG